MHQRTWLSILTFPIVTVFTCPVIFKTAYDAPRVEIWSGNQDHKSVVPDIQEVLELVVSDYVDKPDIEKVINGGIEHLLSAVHPMNSYLTAEDLRLSDPGVAGIGVTVIKKQMYASVISVVPGSPAYRLGIRVGDSIRKLDNDSVCTMSAWTLERRLRGHVGSDLTLLILSCTTDREELKKVTLRREIIKIPPIAVRRESSASIITLTDFNHGRTSELKAILKNVSRDIPLIIDISHCAGGFLDEAASMAGLFVSSGPLATIQEVGKTPISMSVINAGVCSFVNIAVLQGKYTIGAAEAFSSALKRQLVPIFGDYTCGLGVERTRFLLRHGGAVEMVNKWWLGASGEPLGFDGGKQYNQGFIAFRRDTDAPIQPSDHICVLPNYFIKDCDSDDSWLTSILDVLEPKHNCRSIINLPITTNSTSDY